MDITRPEPIPAFKQTIRNTTYRFPGLVPLLAKATPDRSGDRLAGIAAASRESASPRIHYLFTEAHR